MSNWEEQAKCKGMSPNFFSVAHLGDDEVAGIGDLDREKYNKLRRYNRKKMAKAVEVCRGCPVWLECLESANPDDLLYTVRGGVEPLGLEPLGGKKKGGRKPKTEAQREAELQEIMSKPHEKCGTMEWTIRVRSDRPGKVADCVYCTRVKKNETQRKRRAARVGG